MLEHPELLWFDSASSNAFSWALSSCQISLFAAASLPSQPCGCFPRAGSVRSLRRLLQSA